MKRRLAGESRCKDAALRYYLLTEDSAAGPLYGGQAELGGEPAAVSGIPTSRQRVQGLLDGEEAALPDLSPSRRRVQELAAALARGGVTPVALRDVVDDWLLA